MITDYIQESEPKSEQKNDDVVDAAQKNITELVELTASKDKTIYELNCVVTCQQTTIAYQETVIKQLIEEVQTVRSELIQYAHYKPHPKDTYLINFGHHKYRNWTYRQVVSSRDGKKLCSWVMNKMTIDSAPIKEFKRYLRDIDFHC